MSLGPFSVGLEEFRGLSVPIAAEQVVLQNLEVERSLPLRFVREMPLEDVLAALVSERHTRAVFHFPIVCHENMPNLNEIAVAPVRQAFQSFEVAAAALGLN